MAEEAVRTQETKVHETPTHVFTLDDFSRVRARARDTGGMLNSQSVEALLLLDIARLLTSIHDFGIAQAVPRG